MMALLMAVGLSMAAFADAGSTSPQSPTYTTEDFMQALSDIWTDIGAGEIAVHEPSAEGEEEGIVRRVTEIKTTEGSFLRGFCDFRRDDAFVDTLSHIPSNALLATHLDSSLLWTENTANRLRAHLPDLANLLDELRSVADDVCGGMYASIVSDDEASLTGMGATFGIGVRNGEATWNLLVDLLAKAGEVVPGTETDSALKSVSLRSDGIVGRLLGGGREPQLVLVKSGGKFLICGYSSGSVRQRCEEALTNGQSLISNPHFLDKANPILDDLHEDRVRRGFAYVSTEFILALVNATKGMLALPLGLIGIDDESWAFSCVETTADKIIVTSRMPQSVSEALDVIARLGVTLVGNVIPSVMETVKFEKAYEPSEAAKERIDGLIALLRLGRETLGFRGFDYRYMPESAEARAKAGIPETGDDFMATMLSVKGESESSLLFRLFAAGQADKAVNPSADDANAAERYLPDTADAALAFQPDAETWLGLGCALLDMVGCENVSGVLRTAFPVESDRHTCAVALSGESDILIVARISTETAFREVGGALGDVWQLEEKENGSLLVYRRTEGSEAQQAMRFAFHKTEGMAIFATSQELLDQSVAAGVSGEKRLYATADFQRMMGSSWPHNTIRYRADNIATRSTRRLSDLFSGILPEGVISRFLSLNVLNMGECGVGVKSGCVYHRYGRELKDQHAVMLPMIRAAFRTCGDALQRACPYNGSNGRVFSSVFATHTIGAADGNGRASYIERGKPVSGWTFDVPEDKFERTYDVDVKNPLTLEDGSSFVFSDGAIFSQRSVGDSGEMTISFEETSVPTHENGGTINYSAGSPENSYFLLISGGGNKDANRFTFWLNTAMYYSTLTLKYKVPKENIVLLVSDGLSDDADACFYVGNPEGGAGLKFISSPHDLDGDGKADVTGPANYESVSNALAAFKAKLTPADQLTVFISSHGYVSNDSMDGRDCGAYLFDVTGKTGERITDRQLADMTKEIACPVGFLIGTSNSGGFLDDLCAVPNRVVATACRHDQLSCGNEDVVPAEEFEDFKFEVCSYGTWFLPINCAIRGFMPKSVIWFETNRYPWNDYPMDDWDIVKDADANGDGLVSFREASEFAIKFDDNARPGADPHEDPQFAESTPGLGDNFFTLKQKPVESVTFVSARFGTVSLPKAYLVEVTGVHGSYDPDADWDGDGAANYAEYVAGTDPNRADDCLEIGAFTVDENWFTVTFPSFAGRRYSLKAAESPVGPWTDVWFGTSQDEDGFAPSLTRSPESGVGPVETMIYARPNGHRFFKLGVERGRAF